MLISVAFILRNTDEATASYSRKNFSDAEKDSPCFGKKSQ